jgi:predicted esterase
VSKSRSRRAWRVGVGVCLLSGLSLAAAWFSYPKEAAARSTAPREPATPEAKPEPAKAKRPAPPSGPLFLNDEKGKPNVLLYPPKQADEKRPITVMLHGMCDEPEYECPYFANATTKDTWLVCPRANLRCDGGGSIWSGDKRYGQSIEASISRVGHRFPDSVETGRGRTLIGFSLGAIRGMDVAHHGAGKYRGVILIGAKIYPDAKKLRAAGVERIVLAAGENDMMKWHMVTQTQKLVRQGFPAAFMSMGKIGHAFPRDLTERMERAIAWVNGDDGAFVPKERGELAFAAD